MNPFDQYLMPHPDRGRAHSESFTEALARFIDDLQALGWRAPATLKLGSADDVARFRHEASVENLLWDPQFRLPPNVVGQVHGVKIIAPYGEWNYVKRDYDWQ